MKADLIAYGPIISNETWYSDKEQKNVIFPNKFNEALAELKEGDELNVYINSPGGDVFAAVAISSQIKRARSKGVKVNAFIDGVAASAASFLVMACDSVSAYQSSMLMIHKPMSVAFGNALEMRSTAETLDNIEESSMLPLYESKAKADMEDVKTAIASETWLGAEAMSEMFDITVISDVEPKSTDAQAMAKAMLKDYSNSYKHMPENLIEDSTPIDKQGEPPKEPEQAPQDDSSFIYALRKIKNDIENLKEN